MNYWNESNKNETPNKLHMYQAISTDDLDDWPRPYEFPWKKFLKGTLLLIVVSIMVLITYCFENP